jgi:hypothetical protein
MQCRVVVAGGVYRFTCCLSLSTPLLTCPAPRDCLIAWVSDDLHAWPAYARRTAVANVNVIPLVVLDRRQGARMLFCSSYSPHYTTPPARPRLDRPPSPLHHSTPTKPEDPTQRPSCSLSFALDTPTSLPPLLFTSVLYCPRAHLKTNKSWQYCLGQRRRLLLLRKNHHGAYQPSNQLDHPTATWSPARHGRPLRLFWKPCEI